MRSVYMFSLLFENIQLKKKVAELQLAIFWKDHHRDKLNEVMVTANEFGPQCDCESCVYSGRWTHRIISSRAVCIFQPYFEAILQDSGLTVGHDFIENDNLNDACFAPMDSDFHFVNFARRDWTCFTYGAKLWKATSASDPELSKLKQAMHSLAADTVEDELGWVFRMSP